MEKFNEEQDSCTDLSVSDKWFYWLQIKHINYTAKKVDNPSLGKTLANTLGDQNHHHKCAADGHPLNVLC